MPKKREWSIEDDAYILRNVNVRGVAATAQELGVGPETLRKHLSDLNISEVPTTLVVRPDENNDLINGVIPMGFKSYLAGVWDAGGAVVIGRERDGRFPVLKIDGCALETVEYLSTRMSLGRIVYIGKAGRQGHPTLLIDTLRDVLTFVWGVRDFTTSPAHIAMFTAISDFCAEETPEGRERMLKHIEGLLEAAKPIKVVKVPEEQ